MGGIGATAALVLAIALCAASPAAAKLDAGDVKAGTLVTNVVQIDDEFGGAALVGGGYTSCPAGTGVFTAGTYLQGDEAKPTVTLRAHVTSSAPTADGTAWYSDAVNRGDQGVDLALRTVLRCLPLAALTGVTSRSETVQAENSSTGRVTARCPNGHRLISGGSYFSTPGGDADPSHAPSKIVNSTPTADGRGWLASGVAFALLDFTAVARCMPADELARYHREAVDVRIGAHDTARRTGVCPRSHPAVGPAGAFLHRPGSGPAGGLGEADVLSPGGALEATRKFLAAAALYSSDVTNLRLTGRAFCLHR